jgi:hypothetical protein
MRAETNQVLRRSKKAGNGKNDVSLLFRTLRATVTANLSVRNYKSEIAF